MSGKAYNKITSMVLKGFEDTWIKLRKEEFATSSVTINKLNVASVGWPCSLNV